MKVGSVQAARRDIWSTHSPSWMFAVGGGCAGLPILASSSSFLPLQLFWLPPSPPGVVMELLHRKIIPQGVRMSISRTDSPRQQNELLHERLFRTCTYTALKTVCEVICNVVGNPKMTLLGQDMMMCLETGQWCYGCVVYMHVSISSMVLKRAILGQGDTTVGTVLIAVIHPPTPTPVPATFRCQLISILKFLSER